MSSVMKLKYLLPNALAAIRLIAGPLYLIFGTVPTTSLQFSLLLLVAATDLVDGRIARAWKVTSTFGRFLDASADRLLIACVLVKLASAEVVPGWAMLVLALQYALLSAVFLAHMHYFGAAPQPDFWGRLGAGIAAIAGIVGLSTAAITATALLLILFMAANVMYLVVVGTRTWNQRKKRQVQSANIV